MKKILLILLFYSIEINAQNLVVNPSFEDTISCQQWNNNGGWPLLPCMPWYEALASSDYLSMTFTHWCGSTPIPSPAGYQQPLTGTAYCGLVVYEESLVNYREYLGGHLVSPLQSGHKYCCSFFVSAADTCKYFADKIGIYFSVDSVYYTTSNPFTIIPQVENVTGNIINDTMNWVQINGDFIAQGGEKYLCIGNFRNAANTMVDSTTNPNGWLPAAYYYIDDISVVDCTVGIKENDLNKIITIYPNPVTNKFTINAPATLQIEKAELLNCNGIIISDLKIEKEIDVGDLPKGIYVVKVTTNKGVGYKKLVKM